jgi:hypothetical protein
MTDAWTDEALGAALVDLGAHVRVPAHPLWTGVRAELDPAGVPVGGRAPWSRRARMLVAVAAAIVLLLAATLSVAPARRAVADFLGIGSTSVVHDVGDAPSGDLPSARDDLPGGAGERALHAELARAGLFEPARAEVGRPVAWRVDPGGETVVAYADVVLGQRQEGAVPAVKRVPPTGRVTSTTVDDRPAYWIEGPHTRTVGGRRYRSDSALLWVVDGTELRLEGNLPLGSMRRIAESVEPA